MGGIAQFFRVVRRKPLANCSIPSTGGGGPYKGIGTENVPHEILLACSGESGIDAQMYAALHSTIDIDGLYDIIEMRQVADSWKRAAVANLEFGNG